MEEEPTMEVTDRRRVGAESEAAGTNVEEASREPDVNLPPMDVYSLLTTTIALLADGAWGWMGLTTNPFTGQMTKDLQQARVAIDTVAFLVDRVEPRLGEPEKRDLRNLLSNLRVNFVQQSQSAAGQEEHA